MATGENDVVPATGEGCYKFMGERGSLDFPNLNLWRHEGAPTAVGDWSVPLVRATQSIDARAPLGSWRKELVAFGEAVRAGGELGEGTLLTSGRDGLATVAAMAAVLEAVEAGGTIVPAFTLA